MTGKITLILGGMYAGKTSTLLAIGDKSLYAKKKVLYIKPNIDTRSSNIKTHSGREVECISVDLLSEVDVSNYSVILIDEGQFIEDIDIQTDLWANMGKDVYIAALNGTSDRKLFGNIYKLLPKVERFISLNAVCFGCSKKASFSKKINQNEKSVGDIDIGGTEKYLASCRKCHEK